MATTATTGKLTKLAFAGIGAAVTPWLARLAPLKRLWGPVGKVLAYGSIAAPTAAYAINRLKGYDPAREMGIEPGTSSLTSMTTPRAVRPFINPMKTPQMENPLGVGVPEMENPLDLESEITANPLTAALRRLEAYRSRG